MLAIQRVVLVSLLLGGVVTGVGGVAPVAGATQESLAAECHLDRASPEAVISMRERVQQRLGELRTVRENPAVTIEQSTIETVSDRMRNGNLSYDRARYRTACGHYQIAINQSGAALQQSYLTLAEIRLRTVEYTLERREDADYTPMEMSKLSARHEALTRQMANASSLSQARTVAQKAGTLEDDTDDLAQMPVVEIATTIEPVWGSIPVAALLAAIIGGLGAVIGRSSVDTSGPPPEITDDGNTGGTTTEHETDRDKYQNNK